KDPAECLSVILNTEVVSYNYKTDISEKSDILEEIVQGKKNYIEFISQIQEEDKKPNETEYLARIKAFDDEIKGIQNYKQTIPRLRYGFIAEDAPEELVSRDRKTVDTYSSIAMCFGAIQEMQKEIQSLKSKINELQEGNDQ
ncbi:MAG: hypothetical protein K2N24_08560, partial [Lachnospiraceae bacterium]|nr:hypothetical protein [Lachnospiraceae bacterium]